MIAHLGKSGIAEHIIGAKTMNGISWGASWLPALAKGMMMLARPKMMLVVV
jgi:hypothetical protein